MYIDRTGLTLAAYIYEHKCNGVKPSYIYICTDKTHRFSGRAHTAGGRQCAGAAADVQYNRVNP